MRKNFIRSIQIKSHIIGRPTYYSGLKKRLEQVVQALLSEPLDHTVKKEI